MRTSLNNLGKLSLNTGAIPINFDSQQSPRDSITHTPRQGSNGKYDGLFGSIQKPMLPRDNRQPTKIMGQSRFMSSHTANAVSRMPSINGSSARNSPRNRAGSILGGEYNVGGPIKPAKLALNEKAMGSWMDSGMKQLGSGRNSQQSNFNTLGGGGQ